MAMFELPEDEANIKYQLALLDIVIHSGKILTIPEMAKYTKLQTRLKDLEATREIMEAVYEI